jgi:hypothetical protein
MATATVKVEQISSTASRGNARGHELVMDRPEAKGGTNEGMMGGEAVLNGLGGCFMSNLLAAAKARNIELKNARADIEGDMADAPSMQSSGRTEQTGHDCRTRMYCGQYPACGGRAKHQGRLSGQSGKIKRKERARFRSEKSEPATPNRSLLISNTLSMHQPWPRS